MKVWGTLPRGVFFWNPKPSVWLRKWAVGLRATVAGWLGGGQSYQSLSRGWVGLRGGGDLTPKSAGTCSCGGEAGKATAAPTLSTTDLSCWRVHQPSFKESQGGLVSRPWSPPSFTPVYRGPFQFCALRDTHACKHTHVSVFLPSIFSGFPGPLEGGVWEGVSAETPDSDKR